MDNNTINKTQRVRGSARIQPDGTFDFKPDGQGVKKIGSRGTGQLIQLLSCSTILFSKSSSIFRSSASAVCASICLRLVLKTS